MSSSDLWLRARRELSALESVPDFDAAAEVYYQRYHAYRPDYFLWGTGQKARALAAAFDSGSGWAARLLMSCPNIVHLTLDAKALGIHVDEEAPRRLFIGESLATWKSAIKKVFKGHAHRFSIEVGERRIHAHVLCDAAAVPRTVRLGSQKAKPCGHYFEQAVLYTCKPLDWNPRNLALVLEARSRLHRLPRLSGVGNIPRSPSKEPENQHPNVYPCLSSLPSPSHELLLEPLPFSFTTAAFSTVSVASQRPEYRRQAQYGPISRIGGLSPPSSLLAFSP